MEAAPLPPIIPPHPGRLIFLSGTGFLRQEGLTLKRVQNHFAQKPLAEPPPLSPEPPVFCEKVQAGNGQDNLQKTFPA